MAKTQPNDEQSTKKNEDDRLAILKDILVSDTKNDLAKQIEALQKNVEQNQQQILEKIGALSDKLSNDFAALQKNTEEKIAKLDGKLSGNLNQEAGEISQRIEKIHADLNDSIIRHFEIANKQLKETEERLDTKKADQKTISTLLHGLAAQLDK